MVEPLINDLVFLGCAERAGQVQEGSSGLFKWNIIGLKNVIPSFVFPMSFSNYSLGFAFHPALAMSGFRVQVRDSKGATFLDIGVPGAHENQGGVTQEHSSKDGPPNSRQKMFIRVAKEGWSMVFLDIKDARATILTTGEYVVVRVLPNGVETVLDRLHFLLVDPPKLTPERVAAIRSDPMGLKEVRLELSCKFCNSTFRAYSALDRSAKTEALGWQWFELISDEFSCKCGKTIMPLHTIRRNLHGLLGLRYSRSGAVNFVPLYEQSSLEELRQSFAALLESAPREEVLQQYIEANPVLLHQFPTLRLFVKPPILTRYKADFALLTPNKELLLIELETSKTKLMKKKGGMASDLTHAYDQARDWLLVVDEHRLAVLDSLGIEKEDVGIVRAIVIAGRDVGYDAHDLRKLKGQESRRISLLTYDDLLFALDSLIRGITSL